MLRCKSNKNALIIATLIILLCLACLTGATLALFTNSPLDGTVGAITTSGLVDVDIVDTTDEQNSLMGDKLQFQTTVINQEILFEPGAMFHTQAFMVKNEGNVVINYRMYVSNDQRINMTAFGNAFDVWITTDRTNPESGTLLKDFTGRLEPGHTSDEYYLFVKMKESATNEFQGATYEGIGVTVYAVQGNVYNVNEEYNVD